jgi:alkaline phosphatase
MFKRLSLFLFAITVVLSVSAKQPKYIFFFIGDGMGLGHVMTTEAYNRDVLHNPYHILMMQFPVASVATTYSANAPITDSAAAGTALSTGHKTNNGMLGMTPDKTNVYSVAKQLKERGYGIAIATTVPPDDATPAAYYAHQPDRGMFYEIGKDMAASDYDFFVGSRLRGLTDSKSGKETDLMKTLTTAGYKVVYDSIGYVQNKNEKKILLLSSKTPDIYHVGYAIDSVAGRMTLPFITRACIEHEMKVSPNKFFMMVEAGTIDWAAHSNDGACVVKEVIRLNEAVKEAYNFYLKHPSETLIVVTADHNTGGFSFGAYGAHLNLKNVDYQTVSKETFSMFCDSLVKAGKPVDWEWMKGVLKKDFGFYGAITVSDAQNKTLQDAFSHVFKTHDGEDTKTLYANYNEFVTAVFKTFDHYTGFGWTTNSHSGNFAPVFAIGAGSEIFNGVNNNTDLPNKIRKLTGIKTEY